jgi:hypothetical protein
MSAVHSAEFADDLIDEAADAAAGEPDPRHLGRFAWPTDAFAFDPPADPPEGETFAADGPVFRLAPGELATDPDRFQFKRGADPGDGTVRELPAEKFDPDKADPLAVWEDPTDRRRYVVDGHHRHAWATRDNAPWVPVRFVTADDAAGALEAGKAIDAAAKKGGPADAGATFRG